MTDKVESTLGWLEEPMHIPEPQKPGVSEVQKPSLSEESDPAKAAQEILLALNEGLGDSPEVKKVKDLVTKLEETMQEALKKNNPGSSASSNTGSYVVVGSEDDPMKLKSPRSKKSSLGGGSRVPTPEGKRKHEGPLRERLEMKNRESLSDIDLEVLLESLKELEKARPHEAEETKRRKSDDEQAKRVKDENSSLQTTIAELREKGKQLSAQYESNEKAHGEEVAKLARERAALEAQHQVDLSRMAENNALEKKALDENKADVDASKLRLQQVNEALKQEEFAVAEKSKAINRFKEDQQDFFVKSDKQRAELSDRNFVLAQVQRRLEVCEATEASVRAELTSSRDRENGYLGEAQRNTAKLHQWRDEFEGVKAVLHQEQATAASYRQTAMSFSNTVKQEETKVVNLVQELASEQFAYRKHTQSLEAESGTNYAALLKLKESQFEQVTQAHLHETHSLTKQRNDAVLKIQSLEDTVRALRITEQTAKQEAQSAEERVNTLQVTLCSREQELQALANQLAQAQGLGSTVQQLNLENQDLKERVRLLEQQQLASQEREAQATQDWYHYESATSQAHQEVVSRLQREIERLKAEKGPLVANGARGSGDRDDDGGKRPDRSPRSRHDDIPSSKDKKSKKKKEERDRSRGDGPRHVQISTPREETESQSTVQPAGSFSGGPKLEFGPAKEEPRATTLQSQESQGRSIPPLAIGEQKEGRGGGHRQRDGGDPDDGGDDSDSSSSDSDSSSDDSSDGSDGDDSGDGRKGASSGTNASSGEGKPRSRKRES